MTDRPWRFSVATLAGAVALAAPLVYVLGTAASEDLKLQKARRDINLARELTRSLLPRDGDSGPEPVLLPAAPPAERGAAEPAVTAAERHGIESIVLRTVDGLTILATDNLGPDEIAAFGKAQALAITAPTTRLLKRDQHAGLGKSSAYLQTMAPLHDADAGVAGTLEVNAHAEELVGSITTAWVGVTRNVAAVLGATWAFVVGAAWLSFFRRRKPETITVPVVSQAEPSPTTVPVNRPTVLEQEIKSAFIATISHEIRTPINAVVGMAELLKLTDLTRKQQSYVQYVQSSCDMLLSLVENVIDFARLEAGTHSLRIEEFDVVDLVERVLGIMGYPAYSKGVELSAVLRHDLNLRVSADRHRLCQILINLVGNSVKFTDDGVITIDVSHEERDDGSAWLRFEVCDTGHGIDASVRERLFVPFVSSKRQASGRHEGSGLGLAICKQLIDVMGGSIDIESNVGLGTCVIVKVPTAQGWRSAEAAPSASLRGPSAQRVLIAHSNSIAATNIARLLESSGIECETAATTTGMLERLRESFSAGPFFDRLILDADLTPADGLKLARRVRADDALKRLPIVLLNSIVRPLEIGDVSRVGGLICIDKPVLPRTLLKSLQQDFDPRPEFDGDAAAVEPLKILVAEDNAVNIRLLLSMLTAEGHSVDAARDAHAVFAALERNAYDLVFMDGRMPGMDGHRIAEIVRANPARFASQPVMVAVTAEATEEYRAECLAMGMDDFITKPIRLDELRAGIVRWMTNKTSSAAGRDLDESVSVRGQIVDRIGRSDEPVLRNYIGLFLFDTGERLERLAGAVQQGDVETVRHECHAIKGACLDFGAERMTRCCDRVLRAAQGPMSASLAAAAKGLLEEFERLRPIYESATVIVH